MSESRFVNLNQPSSSLLDKHFLFDCSANLSIYVCALQFAHLDLCQNPSLRRLFAKSFFTLNVDTQNKVIGFCVTWPRQRILLFFAAKSPVAKKPCFRIYSMSIGLFREFLSFGSIFGWIIIFIGSSNTVQKSLTFKTVDYIR